MTPRFRPGCLARRTLLGLAVAAASLPAAADALLRGQVTDQATGRVLPTAAVELLELERSTTTTTRGDFRFDGVPPGRYTLRVETLGYAPIQVTVEVPASGTLAQDVTLSAVGSLEEILVTGYRAAAANALQDKRMSDIVKESITADDAGKLPDHNPAEALRRATGVTSTVDQGEGRYVTVRGIDPSYTNITFDSQAVGSPEDTRRVALDTIPADVVAKLEVVKTVTPDMDGNAVGGAVNLVTPSAFDEKDGQFGSFSANYGYYDLNAENPYGFSGAWGQVFGPDDAWGIVLSASYSEREFESENLQGGAPWVEEGDFLMPDEKVLRDYLIERIRKGFVANLEWRPDEDRKLYFRNLLNRYQDTELQAETVWDYRNGDLEDQTPTSGTFTEGSGARLISERLERQEIWNSTLGGEFRLNDCWTLESSFTVGKAEQDTPRDREWAFELDDDMPMRYDTSGEFWEVVAEDEDQFHNAGAYEFDEYARGGQVIEEDVLVGRVDLKREFDLGQRSGYLKFGVKRMERDKESDQDMEIYDGFEDDLSLAGFTEPGKQDFYSSEREYRFGPKIRFGAIDGFFTDNRDGFELNEGDTASESFGVDFEVTEDVSAGYLMFSLESGRATWTGGVRFEYTETDFSAFDVLLDDGDLTGDPLQVSGDNDYSHWLPGLQLRYELRDDLVLRAAWTNTIGRPSYELIAPYRLFEIEEDDDDVYEGEIERGNPDLEPLESMNFDLALEWYLESGGILAAAVFYKDIENPIFTRFQTLEDQDFEGRFYSELFIVEPANADSGEIFGIELNWQQQFLALPAPFNGLGVGINFTYTDSQAEVFERGDLPFFLQSDRIGNAALFYEHEGFEARLAWTYYSEYLDEVGESDVEDIYVDEHGQLDFKMSYAFNERYSVYLEALNITDEPLRFYSGNASRLAENEIYSWNVMAGVQAKF